MRITYPVPAQTSSVFVVVTDRTPADLSSVVPWRMRPAHRRGAREALGTPRLALEAFRSARSPWRRMDLGRDDLKQVRRARHHVVVTSTAPVEEQPEAAQVARAAARAVAEACHGTLYDPLVGGVVYHCAECPGEREDFDLGDDWLGWRLSCADPEAGCARGAAPGDGFGDGFGTVPGDGTSDGRSGGPGVGTGDGVCPRAGGVEGAVGAGPGGCACLVARSRGLRRFGLPEITLTGLACVHSLCAVTALRTAAEALLEGHLTWLSTSPQAPFRSIDHRLRVAGAEYAVVSSGWGEGGRLHAAGADAVVSGAWGEAEERLYVAGAEYAVVSGGQEEGERLRAAEAESDTLLGWPGLGDLRVRLIPEAAACSCLRPGRSSGQDGGNRHPHHTPGLLVA
ncbi:hypothetical protein [Microbispora amethystogenes]|uniref:Uncharacterized protein n=1 Tax=Microbispora amethystogenes TaxID=1427754 RepID=A0ABQ4FFZ6_9ACTN|nr:hypothetical protein [Microbispora amethystogenes]GIH33727.1 hypothetical protein Mam01_38910 [Microbispora amethystogenes]